MQMMKKIATTPVRGNGFIVNSQATTDNPDVNAPSLTQLNKGDNNLLFGSDFTQAGASRVWDITSGGTGATPTFTAIAMVIPQSCKHNIKSATIGSVVTQAILDEWDLFTLSIYYSASGDLSAPVYKASAQITKTELFTNPLNKAILSYNGTRIDLNTYGGGKLIFSIYGDNADGSAQTTLYIKKIVFERGSGSPIHGLNKDAGILGAIEGVYDKFKVISGSITLPEDSDTSDVFAGVYKSYPTGFTKNNTYVLSAKFDDINGNFRFYDTANEHNCTRPWIVLEDEDINVSYYGSLLYEHGRTVNFKVLLMRVD